MTTTAPTYCIIGGGAAGFFGALACASALPNSRVIILEKSRQLLTKVKISGGGRCNVTHHCFDPAELVKHYPRGHKALRGPFSRFQPQDTIRWFADRGVSLKVEEDGRMFPTSDDSTTIINCLLDEANRLGVEIKTESHVTAITPAQDGLLVSLANGEEISCQAMLLATGGSRYGFELAQQLGHIIVPPVPSLFTFNIPDSLLLDLAGMSVENADVTIAGTKLRQRGPLLITHWGFSGPAVLKLSAWGARILHDMDYRATVCIRWIGDSNDDEIRAALTHTKATYGARTVQGHSPFDILPRKLWQRFVMLAGIDTDQLWAQLSKERLAALAQRLSADAYHIEGKTTYKQEFVTCGGIALDEVNFTTMQSRRCPRLYFAGEVLDIDGVTGGFNFQAAWTTSWIAGHAMAGSESPHRASS